MSTTITPVLKTFTEQDICTIRRLWQMDRRQLYPGSRLRVCLRNVEDDDETYGLKVAAEAKRKLAEVLRLDEEIANAESGADLAVESWSVDDNYSVKLRQGRDATYGLRTQRYRCMNDLAVLLRISRNNYIVRKWRSG